MIQGHVGQLILNPTDGRLYVSGIMIGKYPYMKTYWGSGCIAPRILELSTRWR
jgi:hypothetical protein